MPDLLKASATMMTYAYRGHTITIQRQLGLWVLNVDDQPLLTRFAGQQRALIEAQELIDAKLEPQPDVRDLASSDGV